MVYQCSSDYTGNKLWESLILSQDIGPEIECLLELGELIWQRGWAEANAGNVSLALPNKVDKLLLDFWKEISSSSEVVDNNTPHDFIWYLISASGSRFRDFRKKGWQNFCLTGVSKNKVNEEFPEPDIIYPNNRPPTSELISHLSTQNWLRRKRTQEVVVLHVHPPEWIVLSNLTIYKTTSDKLVKDIFGYLPEMKIYFPKGLALLPYAFPGSHKLAEMTLRGFQYNSAVVWEGHGIIVAAESSDRAFDYVEVLNKAAAVYLAINRNPD